MAVAASLDPRGRPWASLLTGPPGFIEAVDAHLLRVSASPPADDPLAANLRGRGDLGLLVIDLRTRQRMRFNGRGLALADSLFLLVDEVYGNCPKYIQKRRIVEDQDDPSDVARPSPVRTGSSLDVRQRALVASADTLFMATWHPQGGADASHRGGRPGFVRVLGDSTLELSDYPGNNMFNTLGNLTGHPRVGLLFVDFETGNLQSRFSTWLYRIATNAALMHRRARARRRSASKRAETPTRPSKGWGQSFGSRTRSISTSSVRGASWRSRRSPWRARRSITSPQAGGTQ